MKVLDFSKPNVIIITIVIILITFAIVYIYSNRAKSAKTVEGFAQYNVAAGDVVSLNALDNVVVGATNPIPLTDSIKTLINNMQSTALSGYVTTADLSAVREIANQAQTLNTSQQRSIDQFDSRLASRLDAFQTTLDTKATDLETKMADTVRNVTALATGASLPALTITAYYGDQAPAGWQLCDGQPLVDVSGNPVYYKRTENSTPTELKTPNLLGRMIIGASKDRLGTTPIKGMKDDQNRELTSRSVGEYGGEEVHQLTIPEMPRHSHKINRNAAGTTLEGCWYPGGLTVGCCGSDGRCVGDDTIAEKSTYGNRYIIPNGDDKVHNNMSPYFVLLYIIKQPLNGGRTNALTLPFGQIDVPTTTAAPTTTPAITDPPKPW